MMSVRLFLLSVLLLSLATATLAGDKAASTGTGNEQPKVAAWPTYLHDDARSGTTQERIAPQLHLQWVHQSLHKPQPAWPPPAKQNFWARKVDLPARITFDRAFHVVSDGQRVYFGSSADDQVRAVELSSGKLVWSFFAEGPVRLAPTIAAGRVYFGSDDGRVYCLAADTGKQVWQFDASPESERVIPGNGRLISAHPVRTGVIVSGGAARFGCGLFPGQGTFQFAVDAKSGKELARGKLGFSPQGYLQRKGDVLQIAQGRAPLANFARVPADEEKPKNNAAPQQGVADFPFAWIQAGEHRIGGGDGKVALFGDNLKEAIWTSEVVGKAYSLAVTDGRLLVGTDQGFIYCFGSEKPDGKDVSDPPSAEDFPWRDRAEQREFEDWAARIGNFVNTKAGYGLLLGGDARHAYALSGQSKLRVVAVQTNVENAAQMRAALAAAGVYGRVVVLVVESDKLPFATKLFNLVVVADEAQRASPAAIARQVRPAGGVMVDSTMQPASKDAYQQRLAAWQKQPIRFEPIDADDVAKRQWVALRRGALEGAGEWTHIYGNPSNTSCSSDALVEGELDIQWFGRPGPRGMVDRHHRTTPPLYADGRLFIPGNEQIYGVDAYNGAVLWHVEMADFRRVGALRDAGNMAAKPKTLYVAVKDSCYALATKDGSRQASFAIPKMPDGKPRHWGLVASVDDGIYGSSTQPNASRSGHSRKQIDETYYDFISVVTSDSVFHLEEKTGRPRWHYAARGAILNPTITIGGDRLYFVESRNEGTLDESLQGRVKLDAFFEKGCDLVALDRRTGKELWRSQPDFSKIQHHLYLAYAQEKLVAVGTRNEKREARNVLCYDLATFDAKTGKPLWNASQDQHHGTGGSHGEQDQHPAIVGDTILQEPYAYDLHSGKRREDWKFHRGGHGCGAISASAAAFFFRAGNPTMCDVATGKKTKVNSVSRPGCWINMIPAGGMLLIPEASSGCTCNFAVQGSMAFAPRDH